MWKIPDVDNRVNKIRRMRIAPPVCTGRSAEGGADLSRGPMSRIRLNVKDAAEERGISNPRELHLKSGVTYSVCYRMWYEADQTRLDLKALARLCDALECGPSDLLVLTDNTRGKSVKATLKDS